MGKPEKNKAAVRKLTFAAFWNGIRENLFSAFFPEAYVCLDCGKELTDKERGFSLCDSCRSSLPYITVTRCRFCGEVLEGKYDVCARCQSCPPRYDKAFSPFSYEGVIRKIILSYKDGNANYLYRNIARLLAGYYNSLNLSCDAVCYVPSPRDRILRRGFEHNRKVAKEFAKWTGLPVIYPLEALKRPDQTKKTREERLKNIQGAFVRKQEFPREQAQGKKLLLIDDVMTTGATVNECAKLLKDHLGAAEVFVLTLARS
jgi:ComF family protein